MHVEKANLLPIDVKAVRAIIVDFMHLSIAQLNNSASSPQNTKKAISNTILNFAEKLPLVRISEEYCPIEDLSSGFKRNEENKLHLYLRLNTLKKSLSSDLENSLNEVLNKLAKPKILLENGTERTHIVSQKGLKRGRYLKFDIEKLKLYESILD